MTPSKPLKPKTSPTITLMNPTGPTTSAMVASYENDQGPSVQDAMELTIAETMGKLNSLRLEVGEMSNKVS